MAKSYIDIVKYMIDARFEISGPVEKPDIIGAIFGQTEGLLGSDLDLRELQKSGKIGRIEIEASSAGNKTMGKLYLPSSLAKVETCILGAAIESVDRVGPFDTVFKVNKIEDTRSEKRQKIVARAKELVKMMVTTELPDSKEISDLVEAEVKSSEVTTYGPDALPAGPDIDKSDDVILVEGRADVITLLRNDISNCIAVGGAAGTVSKTIIDLCISKEATLFVDGDRGGDIIARSITNVADIDFLAKAPDGKEVEELTMKEIIKALRSRVPIEQVFHNLKKEREQRAAQQQRFDRQPQRPQQRPQAQEPEQPVVARPQARPESQAIVEEVVASAESRAEAGPATSAQRAVETSAQEVQKSAVDENYVAALGELRDTLRGRLYGPSGEFSEVPIRELIQVLQNSGKEVRAIVFDGIITQRLIESAYRRGIKSVYGIRAGQISRKYNDMLLYTAEGGEL